MVTRRHIAGVAGAILLVMAGLVVYGSRFQSTFEPPARNGPLGLVAFEGGQALWIATVQEEERSRHVGGSRYTMGRWQTDFYTHLRIEAIDPANAQRLWLKTLKVVKDDDGGHGAVVRILGQQDGVVWAWLHDQLVALSPQDGTVLADRARLAQANPESAGLFPDELAYYTWVGEMVVTLADARRMRITLPDYRLADYTVADEPQFSAANSMTVRWNGGYDTKEFGVRHGVFDGRWIGLLSDREAKDGADDTWGDHFADSVEIDDEGKTARRTFREARVERPVDAYGERIERITGFTAIDGTKTYLQGAMVKAVAPPGTPAFTLRGNHWKPTVRAPLRLADPDGVLVLHRTRLDAQGRLALSRLDGGFDERWTTELPLQDIGNRWELPGRLLLYGGWDEPAPGMRHAREALVSVDLATGAWRAWGVEDEAAFGPDQKVE